MITSAQEPDVALEMPWAASPTASYQARLAKCPTSRAQTCRAIERTPRRCTRAGGSSITGI